MMRKKALRAVAATALLWVGWSATSRQIAGAQRQGQSPNAAQLPSNASSVTAGRGGYDPSLIPFLKERDVALLGADVPQEGGQIPGVSLPIHFFTLVALGVNLLDNLALDELADTASRLKRWEFVLVVEPLRVQFGVGAAVNPVAIF